MRTAWGLFLLLALAAGAQTREPRVYASTAGHHTDIEAVNSLPGTVSICLLAQTDNVRASVDLPLVTTLGPGQKRTLCEFEFPPDQRHTLTWRHRWQLGNVNAKPDGYAYRLPWIRGESHVVRQGFGGTFSHTGFQYYAIDFDMPVGTPVLAARAGTVVAISQESNEGGPSPIYRAKDNNVWIEHTDGTTGIYAHLKFHGATVHLGQHVEEGAPIALSGVTGYATVPHLHFMVCKPTDDCQTMTSLPYKCHVAGTDAPVVPEVDHPYTAP